jgi:hypothetical protein
MEQARLTAPVKPNHGVTLMVEVLPLVDPGEIVSDAPVMVKYGGAVVVNELMDPLVVPALFSATAW